MATLTGNHVPLVQRLQQLRRDGEFTSFRQLARFGQKDWERVVTSPEVPDDELFPPSVPGKTVQEKAVIYAATITRILEDMVPTEVVAFRAQADKSQPDDVQTFWRNVTSSEQASFQLGRGDVRSYLAVNEFLLDGVADREALFASLESIQRMYNVTTSYPLMQTLAAEHLDSAFAITELGQPVFVQRMSDLGVEASKATIMYEKAGVVAANALQLFATYSPAFNNLGSGRFQSRTPSRSPTWRLCSGRWTCAGAPTAGPSTARRPTWPSCWRSSRSDGRPSPSHSASPSRRTRREVLLSRRPDIGEIELTCDNTNVPLPYVDLVNELLEDRIAPFPAFDLPASVGAELDASDGVSDAASHLRRGREPVGDDHLAVVVQLTTH